jgi:hypothetical protein
MATPIPTLAPTAKPSKQPTFSPTEVPTPIPPSTSPTPAPTTQYMQCMGALRERCGDLEADISKDTRSQERAVERRQYAHKKDASGVSRHVHSYAPPPSTIATKLITPPPHQAQLLQTN